MASSELEQIKDRRMDTLHKEQGLLCATACQEGNHAGVQKDPKEQSEADWSDGCGVTSQACLLQEHSWNCSVWSNSLEQPLQSNKQLGMETS